MTRDASNTSLASLGVVVDFLQRRVEVKFNFSLFPSRGTVDKFEEVYHHITFDDGMQRWFKLDFDSPLNRGQAQQMLRDEDGTFSEDGPRRAAWLI